jgi:hypothetical protein
VGVSGTLTGNGTITANGPTVASSLITVDGTLAPEGTLRLNSFLSLSLSATTVCNVTPDGADMIDVMRQAKLRGRLSVTMKGTFLPSGTTRFLLVHVEGGIDPIQARFTSESIKYPVGHFFEPRLTYDYVNNNVYLDLDFTQ